MCFSYSQFLAAASSAHSASTTIVTSLPTYAHTIILNTRLSAVYSVEFQVNQVRVENKITQGKEGAFQKLSMQFDVHRQHQLHQTTVAVLEPPLRYYIVL